MGLRPPLVQYTNIQIYATEGLTILSASHLFFPVKHLRHMWGILLISEFDVVVCRQPHFVSIGGASSPTSQPESLRQTECNFRPVKVQNILCNFERHICVLRGRGRGGETGSTVSGRGSNILFSVADCSLAAPRKVALLLVFLLLEYFILCLVRFKNNNNKKNGELNILFTASRPEQDTTATFCSLEQQAFLYHFESSIGE
jgi:hypothetical protein